MAVFQLLQKSGADSTQQNGQQQRWTFTNGLVTYEIFTGDPDALVTLANTFQAVAGNAPTTDSVELTNQNGRAQLMIATVTDGPVIWELFSNDLVQRVEQAPAWSSRDL